MFFKRGKKLTAFTTLFSTIIFATSITAHATLGGFPYPPQDKLVPQKSDEGDLSSMKSNEIELELTFLAKEKPSEIDGVEPEIMVDTYVPKSGFADLRIRKKGKIFEIIVKQLESLNQL